MSAFVGKADIKFLPLNDRFKPEADIAMPLAGAVQVGPAKIIAAQPLPLAPGLTVRERPLNRSVVYVRSTRLRCYRQLGRRLRRLNIHNQLSEMLVLVESESLQ